MLKREERARKDVLGVRLFSCARHRARLLWAFCHYHSLVGLLQCYNGDEAPKAQSG